MVNENVDEKQKKKESVNDSVVIPEKETIDSYVSKVNTDNFLELYTAIVKLNYSEDDIKKFMLAFNKVLRSIDADLLKLNDDYVLPKIVRDSILLLDNFTINEATNNSSITNGVVKTVKEIKLGNYIGALKCVANISTDIFKYFESKGEGVNVTKKEK